MSAADVDDLPMRAEIVAVDDRFAFVLAAGRRDHIVEFACQVRVPRKIVEERLPVNAFERADRCCMGGLPVQRVRGPGFR